MREYLATHGIATLLTGHTRDDQAETLLMRLARGSGLDGLAGIAPAMDLPAVPGGAAVRILRPLLDLPKSRLEATLRQRGITWVEDPSNQSPAYERSRLRAARAALDAVGLTSETLAASARRLRRARAAVDAMAVEACGEASGVVRSDRCGFFSIDRRRLGRAPEEIFLRIIGRCIRAAGGADAPVSLSRLEALVAELRSRPALERGHWTLARAHIIADGEHLRIEREPGRAPLPVLAVAGGAAVVWDGRFAIETAPRLQGGLEVRALGSEGVREVARAGQTPARSRALRLVPAFWREGRLVAVPCVDFWAEAELRGQISATFLGLRYNWQGTEGSCPTTPQA
jgi:tRNA(Ile)-lysidine synthase